MAVKKQNGSTTPLFRVIYVEMRAKILAGEYAVNTFIESENRLAKDYATSRPTVRKSLQMLINDGLLAPVPGKGYRVLGKGVGGGALGGPFRNVVFLGRTDMASSLAYEGFRARMSLDGHSSTHIIHHAKMGDWGSFVRDRMDQSVDFERVSGLAVFSDTRLPDEIVAATKEHHTPLVCLGLQDSAEYDTVVGDNLRGAEALTQTLCDYGHRDIVLLLHDLHLKNNPSFRMRLAGYRDKMLTLGLEPRTFILKDWNTLMFKDNEAAFVALFRKLQNEGHAPTCLVTPEHVAIELARTILPKLSLSVPGDVSVATFGMANVGQLQFTGLNMKSLTCVDENMEGVGFAAAENLLSRINGFHTHPTLTLLPMRIVERDSVRKLTARRHGG
ncbi:MAG: hypothetical protein A3K19_10480 [Lentisphaerae bacterium RIFOXYB12_FULL_65_16]|nr:MAG: hypothetical protein A3K18_33055 [Lentisphaerae bacterium RIFOXYA12_64_32]OGV87935.1 MAG: hypothetical protein A3K19_10480 [Lentisphaerae bacterium RIFOXYB12_FULL_65_16]